MNNTNEISEGVRFQINTSNIKTSEDGTTIEIIDHELLIENLPNDDIPPLNENIISVDAFNRLYKKEISTLPVQQTARHSIPNSTILNANVNAQVDINRNIISSVVLDATGSQYPKLTLTDKNAFGGGQQVSFLSFGAYNQNNAVGTFTASDTQYIAWERKHGENKILFFGSATASPQTVGVAISSFVLIADFSPDEIILYQKVKLNSTASGPVNTRFLTLNGSDEIEERTLPAFGTGDVSWIGGASVDNTIARYDSITGTIIQGSNIVIDDLNNISNIAELSTTTLKVSSIPVVGSINKVVGYNVGTDTFEQIGPDEVYGQNLTSSSFPTFDRLKVFNMENQIGTTNNLVTYQTADGELEQATGITINNSNIISVGSIDCTTLNTGQGANELYAMNQDVLSTSNVTFNNIFSDGLIQTSQILENILNTGVNITSWNIQSQNIVSDALITVNNPLSISLNYTADPDSALSLYAPSHTDAGILFNMRHLDGIGGANDFISSSVLGNWYIQNDSTGDLVFRANNGIVKGSALSLATLNDVIRLSKSSIELNQTVTCGQAVICDNLTLDPETQPQTILITQSSITDELFRRPYFPVYGDMSFSGSFALALPVTNTLVKVTPTFAGGTLKNCTVPVGDEIICDALIPSFGARVSYSICFESGVNPTKIFECAIIINAQNYTASQLSTTTFSSDQRAIISGSFIANIQGSDNVGLYIRNQTDTQGITIFSAVVCISSIFE